MIWNPWKEIKRLRDQVNFYNEMAMDAGQKVVFLQSDKEVLQGRIDAFRAATQIRMDAFHASIMDRNEKLLIGLQAIAAEEKPTSNATVKRICKIAREAMEI
jgi:hypothetical protein